MGAVQQRCLSAAVVRDDVIGTGYASAAILISRGTLCTRGMLLLY